MTHDPIRQNRLSDAEKLECVREGYDSFAEEWNRTRQGNWKEFLLIDEMLHRGARVLDLGCGNGRLFGYLRKGNTSSPLRSAQYDTLEYTGIDNSSKLIAIAKEKYPNGNFLVGDALHLPFKNDSFDIVLSFAVLHHIPPAHHQQFMKEIDRVLKPEGRALITVWNMFQEKYRSYTCPHSWNRFLPHREVMVPFGEEKVLRYVFAFTPYSLRKLVRKYFIPERLLLTRGEQNVHRLYDARNLVVKLRRKW